MIIPITASLGSGNETVFKVVDNAGNPVDLNALDVTVVTVSVCGPLICGSVSLDSTSDDVAFFVDVVRVKFGKLALAAVKPTYSPKISYVTAASADPVVIAGEDYLTEIKLRVIC